MEPMVIKVCGVPDGIPHGRMVDQLKIHFLKRRNSGGDVLMVIYPTSTPRQAYVVFESNEVPGVLEATHILEVDNRFYPLQVQGSCLSEVDMPVETTLDLKSFKKPQYVRKLVRDLNFKINEPRPDFLQLMGSFLKLKLLRSRLMDLQTYSDSPSALRNGSTLTNQRASLEPSFASKPPPEYDYDMRFDKDRNVPSLYNDFASGGPRNHASLPSYPMRGPPGYSYHLNDRTTQSFQASSSALSSGSSLVYQMEPSSLDPRIAYETTSRRVGTIGGEEHNRGSSYGGGSPRNHDSNPSYSTRRRSSLGDTQSMQASSSSLSNGSSLASQRDPRGLDSRIASTSQHGYHTSREKLSYGQSYLGDRVRTPSRLDGDPLGRVSSYGERMASIVVDTDTIDFILTLKQDHITFINNRYHATMSVKGNTEVTTVTFSGLNAEKAKDCLLATMNDIGPKLRTQEIKLKDYPAAVQKQILSNIQRYENSDVLIKHDNSVIKLVGSSIKSFEMKQKLLELDYKHHRLERSSSVPRQHQIPDQRRSPDPMSQTGTGTGNASQEARGRPQDRRNNFNQRRTHSEHRRKAGAAAANTEPERPNADLQQPRGDVISTKQQLGAKNLAKQSTSDFRKKLKQNKSAHHE